MDTPIDRSRMVRRAAATVFVLILSVDPAISAKDRRGEIATPETPAPRTTEPGTRGRVDGRRPDLRVTEASYIASRVEVESAAVTFGSVVPDEGQELPGAVAIRVFSPRPWSLRLVPTQSLSETQQGRQVDWSRLQWRSRTAAFRPFAEVGATVARGLATPPAGELVIIDLRLEFAGNDPLGLYSCSFRVVLD